jgi:hypothetical protein
MQKSELRSLVSWRFPGIRPARDGRGHVRSAISISLVTLIGTFGTGLLDRSMA